MLNPVQDELWYNILISSDPELEPKLQIPAPVPAKSFGSLLLRLHNTAYFGSMTTYFWILKPSEFNFIVSVFEAEYCGFRDVGRTRWRFVVENLIKLFRDVGRTLWRFVVENLIKLGPSYPKILVAELTSKQPYRESLQTFLQGMAESMAFLVTFFQLMGTLSYLQFLNSHGNWKKCKNPGTLMYKPSWQSLLVCTFFQWPL